eukprot:gnl/Hemi2/23531_TR7890_c0_g1_i1.p1 gnl/Hemi2/23531_TR7890_c0_g1~~gnl/Hemi2/23531_TR7890_c0_g1_i1.p1  ORF type:complete len:329 (+),score=80.48 gnl/Hemi2/23531_TR7890_c0_g1_i1:189-1175(+)
MSSSSSHEVKRCYGCNEAEKPTDNGLTCDNGHYLHGGDCLQNFFNHCLDRNEWHNQVPLRCQICRVEYYPTMLEALMNEAQRDTLMQASVAIGTIVGPGEELFSCPFCPYSAIYYDNLGMHFLPCQRPRCQLTSCIFCKKRVTELDADQHFACAEHSDANKEILRALHDGSTRSCPSCHLAGMKDHACTQITCTRCNIRWCYFCGQDLSLANRPPNTGDLGHNHRWKTNPAHCPLWMNDLSKISPAWPDDGIRCLELFHRAHTLRLLHDAVLRLTVPRVQAMLQVFPGALSGYSLDEIVAFDPAAPPFNILWGSRLAPSAENDRDDYE